MNRSKIFTFALCLGFFCSKAQVFICNQVIGSTGSSGYVGSRYFAYTLGETVIATASGPNLILTQGFHQPDICGITSTDNPVSAAWGLEVFPIPTADVLHIRFTGSENGLFEARVFNVMGRVMLSGMNIPAAEGAILNCSNWPPGVYFLELTPPGGRASATIRFIRL